MTYFLDFDRTLFDTDAFVLDLPNAPGCAPFAGELRAVIAAGRDETLSGGAARLAAWSKVGAALESGALTFLPGALARFVYPDVPDFLRAKGSEAIVISYGVSELQHAKVESALDKVAVLYTGEQSKAAFLAAWPGYHGEPAIAVDDRAAELEALATAFPALRLFEMRRDGKPGDGRWPVVRALAELP